MAAFNFRRRHTRRWWYAGVTLVAAAAFFALYVGGAVAVLSDNTGTPTSPSQFESNDGNMTIGGNTDPPLPAAPLNGLSDWNCFFGQTAKGFQAGTAPTCSSNLKTANAFAETDPAATTSDNSWNNGTKMDKAVCPPVVSNKNPAKDDFVNVASYNETSSNNHLFLYGATIRFAANGNASENVELNQVASTSTCSGPPSFINRTAGDRLLAFDYLNGGTNLQLHVLTWITPTFPNLNGNSGTCVVAQDSPPCWGAAVIAPSSLVFEGEANQGPIPAADNAISGTDLVAGQFAEFGVDLTNALSLSTTDCSTFAQAVWESRSSGSSFSSNPEDIAIENKTITNCGQITLVKHTNPRGLDQSFAFTSTINDPVGTSTSPTCTADSTPSAFSLNDKSLAISSVSATNPAIVTVTGHGFADGSTVTISGAQTTPSIDGNQTITKIDANSFSVPVAVTTGSTGTGTVIGDSSRNTEDCINVIKGTYTVTETLPAANSGYAFASLRCVGGEFGTGTDIKTGAPAVFTNAVTIHLDPDQHVTCTWVNNQVTGALLIKKESTKTGNPLVTNAGATFCYSTSTGCTSTTGTNVTDTTTVTTGGDQDTTTGEVCVAGLTIGTYYVNETGAPSGYGTTSSGQQQVTVTGGTDCGNSKPSSGATGLAVFTDPPLSQIEVKFIAAGSPAQSETHATIVCKDSSNNALTATATGGEQGQSDTAFNVQSVVAGATTATITLASPLSVSSGTLPVVIAGTTTTGSINQAWTATVTSTTTLTIPVTLTSGQASAGGTLTVFDDTDETFGNGTANLLPGTYSCTVVIDP